MKKYKWLFVFSLSTLLILTVLSSFMLTDQKVENESKKIKLISQTTIDDSFAIYTSDAANIDSLANFVSVSTDCFVGKFITSEKFDNYIDFEFLVSDKVFGNSNDKYIRVRVGKEGLNYAGNLRATTFTKDHEYLLLLRKKNDNLFLEYPIYSFMGHLVIDFSDFNNAKWERGKVIVSENTNKADVINYIHKISKETGIAVTTDPKVFRTEDEKTVIKNCDLVLKIKPRMLITDGELINCSSYFCEVTECLKGEYSTNEDGVVIIRTLKHALDSGEECIIALSTKNQDFSYDQASPICIFDADDAEMEAKIKGWLSEKKVP